MRLRVTPLRFRTDRGKIKTKWEIEYFSLMWGWEYLYHRGFVGFTKKEDALEYLRLYNSLKKRKK